MGLLLRDGNTVFPTHLVACTILFKVTYQIASLFDKTYVLTKIGSLKFLSKRMTRQSGVYLDASYASQSPSGAGHYSWKPKLSDVGRLEIVQFIFWADFSLK